MIFGVNQMMIINFESSFQSLDSTGSLELFLERELGENFFCNYKDFFIYLRQSRFWPIKSFIFFENKNKQSPLLVKTSCKW